MVSGVPLVVVPRPSAYEPVEWDFEQAADEQVEHAHVEDPAPIEDLDEYADDEPFPFPDDAQLEADPAVQVEAAGAAFAASAEHAPLPLMGLKPAQLAAQSYLSCATINTTAWGSMRRLLNR